MSAKPNTQAPPAQPAEPLKSDQIISEGNEQRRKAVDAIFATPEGPGVPNPEDIPRKPLVPPSEPAAPEPPKPEVPIIDPLDELEEDFDTKPIKPATKKPEDEAPLPKEEDERRSIATMREQLQIQGRRAKELQNIVTEREMELKARDEEIARLKLEVEKPSRLAQNPRSSPKISAIATELEKARDVYADSLEPKAGSEFSRNFESMLREYAVIQNTDNPEARRHLVDTLREKIGTTIGDDEVKSIMSLLANHSDKYLNMRQMIDNIGDLAEEEEIQSRVNSWDEKKGQSIASIAAIADVSDEFISANPDSPQSFVAKMVKSDPAYKDRADKVKAAVVEAFYGKRPFTREEMQRLKDNEEISGVKVNDFIKERGKREEANRNEMMKRAYLATMLIPELPDILSQVNKLNQAAAAKEDERAALLSGAVDRRGEDTKPQQEVKPSERPSAVGNVLAAMRH